MTTLTRPTRTPSKEGRQLSLRANEVERHSSVLQSNVILGAAPALASIGAMLVVAVQCRSLSLKRDSALKRDKAHNRPLSLDSIAV